MRTLAIWIYKGSHRIDRNKDGNYDEERAVQIMDAWWPRAVEAMFKPTLGTELFNKITGMIGLDNEPNNHGAHLGSACQDGWYGYVNKDLRQLLGENVKGPLSRPLLRQRQPRRLPRARCCDSLEAALAVPKEQLYQDSGCTAGDETCFDAVRFRADRRDHGALDPLDQPAHLPAGGRRCRATGRASGLYGIQRRPPVAVAHHEEGRLAHAGVARSGPCGGACSAGTGPVAGRPRRSSPG